MTYKMQSGENFAIQTKGGGRIIVPNVVAEPQFNPTSAYAVNAKVWYGARQFICTTATTEPAQGQSNPTPEMDAAHWSVLPAEEMAKKSEVDTLIPLLFAQYYPDGNVRSAAEFTANIKYGSFDEVGRTVSVLPFCVTRNTDNDNSGLIGRVVIPPFVDTQGNGYISDDGTKYKVVALESTIYMIDVSNDSLTAIVAPTTVTNIGEYAFHYCSTLASVSLPSATIIGEGAFYLNHNLKTVSLPSAVHIEAFAFQECTQLASVELPAITDIGESAFNNCPHLMSVSAPAATNIVEGAFYKCIALPSVSLPNVKIIEQGAFSENYKLKSVLLPAVTNLERWAFQSCATLASIDFGDTPRQSVPTLGEDTFSNVPTTCKIIVPDEQYDAWTTTSGWSDLVTAGYKFLKHSEWEYARKYEVSQEIQDAIEYAVVVDDGLVPTEGPGTSEVLASGGNAVTYLAGHLPAWTCNGTFQSAVERNRGASEQSYHYDPSLFPDRIVFWIEGKSGGEQGLFTRSIVFPKSGVYTLDIEYAAGYAYYPDAMGQARFVVDAGTSGPQDVIGVSDPSIVQHAQVQFAANAGAGNIFVKGKAGLSGNSCCVVIASVKVVLVKETGIEIGDIVAPDASAQTGQAADAAATYEALNRIANVFAGMSISAEPTQNEVNELMRHLVGSLGGTVE